MGKAMTEENKFIFITEDMRGHELALIKRSEHERLRQIEKEHLALKNFFNFLCHSENNLPIDIEINSDEVIRLKRLDENVKNKIKELKEAQELLAEQEEDKSCPMDRNIKDKLKLLESLRG
jgi:hypothetical protein